MHGLPATTRAPARPAPPRVSAWMLAATLSLTAASAAQDGAVRVLQWQGEVQRPTFGAYVANSTAASSLVVSHVGAFLRRPIVLFRTTPAETVSFASDTHVACLAPPAPDGLPRLVDVREVILAMDPDVEGDATALYLARLLKATGVKVTRLAHGVAVGTPIEFADKVSLARALQGRREM